MEISKETRGYGGISGLGECCEFKNNKNYGNISSSASHAGGISGVTMSGSHSYDTNAGDVIGKDAVGGISGYYGRASSSASTMTECSNNASITSSTPAHRGDLIGQNDN